MVTHAVRLTHTAATDDEIVTRATHSCLPLMGQLRAAIGTQLPAAQAAEVLQTIDAQAETNFLSLLVRIRTDRARRAAQ